MTDSPKNPLSRRDFLIYTSAASVSAGIVLRTDAQANQGPITTQSTTNGTSGAHTIYGYA